jgi:hypothetical protein
VKGKEYEFLTFFSSFDLLVNFDPLSSIIPSSTQLTSYCIYIPVLMIIKILNCAVSSAPAIKSSFNVINVMCIGSCSSPKGLLQLCHIANFNYIFVMIFMVLSIILSNRHKHVICVLRVRLQTSLFSNTLYRNISFSLWYLPLKSNPSSFFGFHLGEF